MLKKWIALVLSLVLMLSALPVSVWAETEPTTVTEPTAATEPVQTAPPEGTEPEGTSETTPAEEETKKPEITAEPVGAWDKVTPPHELRTQSARIQLLRNAIAWDYQNALVKEDAESLKGYCGLLASYQLYHRGINTWRRSADGKDYYDIYSAMNYTDGGYAPRAYSAQEHTLAEALNKASNYGTLEIYNVLACFEKTDTEAGQKYGHVVFIYGIIDGKLYFTEGGNMMGMEAGTAMECTIAQFAASYDTWTEFEGLIVLGCRDYMDNCAVYDSDLFASCISPVPLMTMPYEGEDSQPLRTTLKGERLHVIGLYENREEQHYYQIDDGGVICYAQASALLPILYLHESFTLTDPKLPETLAPGKDFSLDGTLEAPGALLSRVCVQILDADGQKLQEYVLETDAEEYDLGSYQLNRTLDFSKLPEGEYTCLVQADSRVYYMRGKQLTPAVQTVTLVQQPFRVGEQEQEQPASEEVAADVPVPAEAAPTEPTPTETVPAAEPAAEPAKNGWYYEQQTWYCYDRGAPRTGWSRSAGVDYYLKEDGSVTTGWATIDGQQRLFTATGALYTGWVKEQDGTKYLDQKGLLVHGWQMIDGAYYYFDEQGLLQESYTGSALRQLRQMGLTLADIRGANTDNNIPQEE